TDLSLVRTADDQVRLLVDGDLNALGNLELDRVRLAESEGNRLALELSSITDADDVELLFEAGGDAGDSVGDECSGEPVDGAVLISFAQRVEHAIFLLELDAARDADREFPLRPLNVDLVRGDGDLHTLRNRDWFATDT